jgi:hypothetical protein
MYLKFISHVFNTTTKWTNTNKGLVLKSILDKIILNHDSKTKLHHLDIHLRIPLVLYQNKKGESNDTPLKMTSKPLKTSGDYIQSRPFYSTVMESPPTDTVIPTINGQDKGYFLTMVIRVTSSNLWTSPYSDHQQNLFNIIREFHEDRGMNFVQITQWLNDNNYLTPRGKVFSPNHTWSIYTKKKRSIKRFSREDLSEVISSDFDVVNYIPNC